MLGLWLLRLQHHTLHSAECYSCICYSLRDRFCPCIKLCRRQVSYFWFVGDKWTWPHLLQNHSRMALQHVVAALKPGSGSGFCSVSADFSLFLPLLYMCTSQPLRNQVYLPRLSWGKWRSTVSEIHLGSRQWISQSQELQVKLKGKKVKSRMQSHSEYSKIGWGNWRNT